MRINKRLGVLAGATAIAVVSSVSAHAGPTDVAAFTQYADAVVGDTTVSIGIQPADNITCDPAAVVDGHMVNPRAGAVVGEVYAQIEMLAHWKCVSLDTGKVYTVSGTLTDMYFSAGFYRAGPSTHVVSGTTAGAGTVNPLAIASFAGGSAALNTWHYAHFVGTTSTGHIVRTNSQLFYVAGV